MEALLKNIPIFLICDDNYSPYMAVMIASVCENTGSHISFHAIGKGLSEKNRLKIEEMKEKYKNFEFDYKVFDASKTFNIPYLKLARMSSSTYIRMALPDLYPEINKALIMDVDIIALDDIAKLWNQDLEGCFFAAANDALETEKGAYLAFKKNMEVEIDCNYANCGVMIIDCEKWRKNQITQKCLEIEEKYRDKLTCADQDVINKVFLGEFKELDTRFNSLFGLEDNIVNRHFCHLRKPWFSQYNVEGDLIKNFDDWWKYAEKTPFYEELKKSFEESNGSAEKTNLKYRQISTFALLKNNIKRKKNA